MADAWKTLPAPDPLPVERTEGRAARDGASIWFASFGAGPPLILLHGGDASSDLWGDQVPAFVAAGWRVVTIDSRGHGRSTRDGRPLHYAQMADDVIAVMDAAGIDRAAFVGWSDGAIVALVLAMSHPERQTRVFAFGANMDLAGLNPAGIFSPILGRVDALLAANYRHVSETPRAYHAFARWVLAMQLSEPNYTAADLAAIRGPAIAIADGEHEEFIRRAHTLYLARTILGAELVMLPGVSHFAPLQDPAGFNAAVLAFLGPPPAASAPPAIG
ncbi:MAG TPA: alpha/beta fold hydrolase [Caulobacteraceae bacterium]|jgi:pimeloyl-ACP methyl ester carboxylesterase|nr:alpha/beta fold hydrolase [Caulobacteraceae bacterium]